MAQEPPSLEFLAQHPLRTPRLGETESGRQRTGGDVGLARPRIAVLSPIVSLQGASEKACTFSEVVHNSNGDNTSNSAPAFPRASVGQSSESDVMVNRHLPDPASSRMPTGQRAPGRRPWGRRSVPPPCTATGVLDTGPHELRSVLSGQLARDGMGPCDPWLRQSVKAKGTPIESGQIPCDEDSASPGGPAGADQPRECSLHRRYRCSRTPGARRPGRPGPPRPGRPHRRWRRIPAMEVKRSSRQVRRFAVEAT